MCYELWISSVPIYNYDIFFTKKIYSTLKITIELINIGFILCMFIDAYLSLKLRILKSIVLNNKATKMA